MLFAGEPVLLVPQKNTVSRQQILIGGVMRCQESQLDASVLQCFQRFFNLGDQVGQPLELRVDDDLAPFVHAE